MKHTLLAFIAMALLSTAPVASGQDTLRIAHLTDPQLGFGPGGFDDDLAAFEREVAAVNALSPDLVVIAGDMVNAMDSASVARFKAAAASFGAPVVLTPGNHDIAEPPTERGLRRYRDAFGPDFGVTSVRGRDVVAFNAMLLKGGPADETAAAEARLDSALTAAESAGRPVIAVCHIPPYVAEPDEAEAYFNLPKDLRHKLLERFTRAGVVAWLCGHTHRTHRNDYSGMAILNPENTSCNFDGRPRGFRLLTLAPDNSLEWDFVPVD